MADIENFIKRIEQNKWECLKCNKYHMSKSNVKRHIETVHLRFKIYRCPFCQKKFGQKCELEKHVKRIHESEKLFAIHKLYDKKKEVDKSEIACPTCKSVVFHKIGNGIFRYHNGISDFANKLAKKVPKKIGPRSKTMAKDVRKKAEEAATICHDEVLQDDPNYTSDESTEDNDDEADPDWKAKQKIITRRKKGKKSQKISKTKHF